MLYDLCGTFDLPPPITKQERAERTADYLAAREIMYQMGFKPMSTDQLKAELKKGHPGATLQGPTKLKY